jgi:glycosyltransferase involved in cell wall biosynthesis
MMAERLGDRLQFVSDRETLSVLACAVGLVRILTSSLTFRPQKLVLSLKQANVIGRVAALFAPWLTCVAFEHIAEYRAHRLQGLYGPLLRLLSWRVDEVWADCSETLEKTRGYFLPRRRQSHVIPLFVAEPRAPAKTTYALTFPVRIAAAGRLVERKNVPAAVEVVARLRALDIDVTLDVYGDGPEKARIEALVARSNLQERVNLRGHQPEWAAQVVNADVFLNLSDTEGFCITVAEAMLAGLPTVAVDVGGIRDYGRDGENMLKLTTADSAAASAAIVRIIRDTSLRERLGRQGRIDMLRDYDSASCRRQVQAALYENETAAG